MTRLPDTEFKYTVGKYQQNFAWFKCEECGDVYELRIDVGTRWTHCGCMGGKKLDINKKVEV